MDPSKEVQLESYIKKVEARLARLETRDIDLKGRGAVNARDAVQLQDYVTLKQLQAFVANSLSPRAAAGAFVCTVAGASGTQSIPLATFTLLEFDTTLIGVEQHIHNPSSSLTRFTINKPGYYISFCQSLFTGAVGMDTSILLQGINGSGYYRATDTRIPTTAANPTNFVFNINFLNQNDYVEFFIYHSGGGGAESTAAESFAGVLKVG